MIRIRIAGLLLLHSLLLATAVHAQSIPVGTPGLEDAYRRAQLLGRLDSSISFTIRPFSPALMLRDPAIDPFNPDSVFRSAHADSARARNAGTLRSLAFRLLPVSWQQQYNSALPYGWNDGGMIPAKGYQTMISAGFFLKAGPLSIQMQPEYVYAANADFEFNTSLNPYFSLADIPGRFGDDVHSELSWGQSSIKINAGPLAFGISNENLWWGPGRRNSLILSNNSRGFKHFTLHTNRPIRTLIGSFETQLIGGKLTASDQSPLNSNPAYTDWRYLSSMTISYQPKWIPGLFFGFNRSFQAYNKNLNGFGDYFPFFTPFQKSRDSANVSGGDEKDQLASFHVRWLFPKAHAEVYAEYGTNDHSHNLRDFAMSPEHSRAYLFGFRKLVPLKGRADEFVQVNAEITQMSQSPDRLVRDSFAWYAHSQVLHGYTHRGEVLGAGIGPGGNLQSLDVAWTKGLKTLGLGFERYVHNNDYYYAAINDLNGQSRRWVDLAFAATGTWNFNNLLLNAKLQGIQTINYQWQMKNYTPDAYYIPENDIFNVHAELGLMYRF